MDQQPNGQVLSVEEWNKFFRKFQFQHEHINKLVANYLVRAGYKEAAEKFTQESGVSSTMSLRSLDARVQIVNRIRKGNALDAARLVKQFFPGLLEADPLLNFQLLQLHVIELIRAGCIEDALFFTQTLPFVVAEHPPEVTTEIERTLTLLIFENPLACPYGALLKQSHRDRVGHAFNEAILKRTCELPDVELDHLLKMVHWCQDELSKGRVRFVRMKNFATATLESNEQTR